MRCRSDTCRAAARETPPANPPAPAAGNYNKAPSIVADDGSLTWHGITLYGAIDMGLAYQTHGSPLSNSAGFGLGYLISKNSNKPYFGAAPNALSASNIGLKGNEELFPGLSAVFNLQTSFLPTSGRLADGLGSIVQNNGVPLVFLDKWDSLTVLETIERMTVTHLSSYSVSIIVAIIVADVTPLPAVWSPYLAPAPIPVRRVVVIGIAPVPAAAHEPRKESKAVTEMVEMVEMIEAGKAGIKAAIKA